MIQVMDTKDEGMSTFQSLQNQALGQLTRSSGYSEGSVPVTITEDANLGQALENQATTLEKQAAAVVGSAPAVANALLQQATALRTQSAVVSGASEPMLFGYPRKRVLTVGALGALAFFAYRHYAR